VRNFLRHSGMPARCLGLIVVSSVRRTTEISSTLPLESLRRDLSQSFHRGHTSFFVKGRYHSNVIDLDNPGHLGVLAGRVERVSDDGRLLRLRTDLKLERYDGLRVVPPAQAFYSTPQHASSGAAPVASGMDVLQNKYTNSLPEFSLRAMRVSSQKVFEAPAGVTVDLELPPEVRHEAPGMRPIQAGDLVYRTRYAKCSLPLGQGRGDDPKGRVCATCLSVAGRMS
jgi:hypothetical protein